MDNKYYPEIKLDLLTIEFAIEAEGDPEKRKEWILRVLDTAFCRGQLSVYKIYKDSKESK